MTNTPNDNHSKLAVIAVVAAIAAMGLVSPASARTSHQKVRTAPAFRHEWTQPQRGLYNSTVVPPTDYDSGAYSFNSGDMGGIGR
jgi:hypothetical protein